MLLYHGTSAAFLPEIRKDGLVPRGKKKSNWSHSPSRTDCVYLTDAYAPYFAVMADDKKQEGCAIVEIDTDRLMFRDSFLLPDEDALEQVGRGHDSVPGDMGARTRWYKKNLTKYNGKGQWILSLKALGTCCHYGEIPVEAITRIAVTDPKKNADLLMQWDVSVTLTNYRLLGDSYKRQMALLFHDPVPEPVEGSIEFARAKFASERGFKTPDLAQLSRIITPNQAP
jgi:hypothetical protein